MSLQITQSWVWQPTKISGCAAWFDAQDSNTIVLGSGSNVSQWLDKSIRGNNASGGTSPTYATGSGVVFNGTNQYLTTSYTAQPTQGESFFAVTTWTGTTQTNYQLIGASANNGRQYGITKYAGSNTVRWFRAGVAGYADTAGVTTAQFLTSGLYDTTNGGSTALNGSNMSAQVAITFSGGTTNLGAGYSNAINDYFKGTINEIVIYDRSITTAERQQVEGYLAYKWGLQSYLPSTHPYKVNPPFQNTIILQTVPSGPILAAKATPSSQFSGAGNKIGVNVFTPLSLSNYGNPCIFWYDAQDQPTVTSDRFGNISLWKDKSGNGYNLVPNGLVSGRIQYSTDANNFKYLSGDSVLSYVPPSPALDFTNTSFFIVYADSNVVGLPKYVFGAIPPTSEQSETSGSGFIFESTNRGPGTRDVFFYAGDNTSYIDNQFSTDIPLSLFEFKVNTGPPKIYSWVNGFSSNNVDIPTVSRTPGAQGISLGGYYDGTSVTNNTDIGSVYEVIGVFGVLNDDAREKVEGYFAWKYGQKPNIPQDSQYILYPPRGTTW